MPSTTIVRATFEDIARSEAWSLGFDWSHQQAGYVLWEHTGFPSFWPSGMTPLDALRSQVREHCDRLRRGVDRCPRCGNDAFVGQLCFSCEVVTDAIWQRRALNP